MTNAIRRVAERGSKLVERCLPDVFLSAIILTGTAFVLALVLAAPAERVDMMKHIGNLFLDD